MWLAVGKLALEDKVLTIAANVGSSVEMLCGEAAG